MKKMTFLSVLIFFLCVSCVNKNNDNHRICLRSRINVYENEDSFHLIGLNSVYVIKESFYNNPDKYFVRMFLDDSDSTFFSVDINANELRNLEQYLDSCVTKSLKYGEELCYSNNECDVFNKDMFLLSCYNANRNIYVDVRISPQKLKSIIVEAERIIESQCANNRTNIL